jgi:restriction system protein
MDGLLTVFLLVMVVAAAYVLLQPASPDLRARLGEWRVQFALKRGLPASHYTVFSNVSLPQAPSGKTACGRLGHVVISPYGIFVIATRHLSGRISGGPADPHWTWKRWRSKTTFRNPLRVNDEHIAALSDFLGVDGARFYSLLVYTGAAEFETAMPVEVTQLGGLAPFIQVRTQQSLGFEEAERVAGRMASNRPPPGIQTAAAHLAVLRETHGSRFSAKQAMLALGLMAALLLAAGSLIHRLAEMPGRYPSRDPGAAPSPFVENAPPPRITLPGVAGQQASAVAASTARPERTKE